MFDWVLNTTLIFTVGWTNAPQYSAEFAAEDWEVLKKKRSIDTKCVNKLLMIDMRHEYATILTL